MLEITDCLTGDLLSCIFFFSCLFVLLWFVCFMVLVGFGFWGVFFLAPLSFVILTQDLSVNFKSYMDTLKSFPFTELRDGEKNPTAQEI